MKPSLVLLTKRFYTNKDLLKDKFGRLFYLPKELQRLGWEVKCFVLDFRSKESEIVSIEGISFESIPVFTLKGLGKLVKLLCFERLSNVSHVLSSGDSYFGLLGMLLSKRLNAELVFDVYDDYTEFGSNKLACMKRIFFRSLKKSSLVVFASSSLYEKYDVHCKSSIVIENGVDTQVFRPMQLEDCRSTYDLPMGVEIVGYFGTIHVPRGTDVLVEAIRILRKERDVLLVLSGHIDGEVEIEADFVKYFGMLPQSQVAELVNACNVVALPYRDLEVMRMTNACKLMEYAACEKTVVCSDIHGYCHYASEGVVLAKPGDAVDLARALKEALVGRNLSITISVLSWRLLAKRLDYRLRSSLG